MTRTPSCAAGTLLVLVAFGCGQGTQAPATRTPAPPTAVCTPGKVVSCTERCRADDLPACIALAVMYESGQGVPREESRASTLFGKACSFGDHDGCDHLARRRMEAADGVRVCVEEGAEACVVACDKGILASCNELARRALTTPVLPDGEGAAALLARSCNVGDEDGCLALADLLDSGTAIARDEKRAQVLRARICSDGSLRACQALESKEFARASQTYQRLCDEDGLACGVLVGLVDAHLYVPSSPDVLHHALSRMCASGVRSSCFRLSEKTDD